MDENLIFYGIQFKNRTKFEDRYKLFSSKDLRDKEFDFLTQDRLDVENVAKVELIIRVETEV